ncbi:hypothetical protein BGW36DRAFT_339699 [Talaromyces proteolyticus]|uniref:Uncharacterized protein n=1 Tax=Talaromyces proteolyticus TaxID=1131652 RepID=A0AAD4KSR0_9EURO|nr:uncharacterized protein BGW36DRAFT_339699 [Talaromyces proteolyticus]KAH8698536.1 hypothetical protein BGW36DRAFT_339699 [Talaromyces proteolyticus]
MGYTHYYSVRDRGSTEWQQAWPALIADALTVVEATRGYVDLSGPAEDLEDYSQPPSINVRTGIHLNGVGSNSHEDFILQKNGQWRFCKTRRKSYDVVVTCILLRAFMLAPGQFHVSSDGSWAEWMEARDLYDELWPDEDVRCPWGEGEEESDSEETGSINGGS